MFNYRKSGMMTSECHKFSLYFLPSTLMMPHNGSEVHTQRSDMTEKTNDTTVTLSTMTLKVPVSTVERCAALVRWAARKPAYAPTGHISRAGLIRLALVKGLDVLERERDADQRKADQRKGGA
jgi:hypothetical protein